MKTNKIIMGMLATVMGLSSTSFAASVTTGNMNNTATTAAKPLITTINATPRASIRLAVGGAKFIEAAEELSVSIDVDASTPTVTAGSAADQAFVDDVAGAAYFGYYLTTGVRSSNQTAANVNVKVAAGTETAGRSFFLLGHGAVSPTEEGDLTVAGAETTFVTVASNTNVCGTNHAANLSGVGIPCDNTDADMDLTQFVKVELDDAPDVAIISQLVFTAVAE